MTESKADAEVRQFVASTPKSKALKDEAAQYLPGGSSRGTAYFAPYPTFVDHAKGHYVYDVDGNGYLDFMINATTHIMGHAHPDIVAALQEQAERGNSFSGPTEAQVRLAKNLCERVPSLDTVRFTNSGTEGTMKAIRGARAFTGKHKIAKFEGGYHGSHEYVSVSVRPPATALGPDATTPVPEHPGAAAERRRGCGYAAVQRPCDRRNNNQSAQRRTRLRHHGSGVVELRIPCRRLGLPAGDT